MKRKVMVAIVIVLALLVASRAGARAGGWVEVTLDEILETLYAGEVWAVGLMARQHGRTPVNVEAVTLTATHNDTGTLASATAEQSDPRGHYVASLTFPEDGAWTLQVDAPPFPTTTIEIPLTVHPARSAPLLGPRAASPSLAMLRLLVGTGVALLVLGAFLLWRRGPAGPCMGHRGRSGVAHEHSWRTEASRGIC